MADSFFGLETSLSNLNDDEGGGEPFEDEYDALNDETFGQVGDVDWEMEHEHLAEQLESSRRHNTSALQDETAASSQLEASLSQLVLDETDAPQSRSSINNVWGLRLPNAAAPTPLPILKNVCTVEELERQLRQKQMQQPPAMSNQTNQSFFQPRFPPVILQRPPGLQAPVPLPFAPQQSMTNMNQMTQPINKMIGHNNQLSQSNMMQNQLSQNLNQLSQPVNQLGQNINQLNQSQLNQLSQNQFLQTNQMNNFQNNQLGQGNLMNLQQSMQIGQSNQLMQNHVNQNMSQLNQNAQNQLVQNMNHLSQNTQNVNQLGQNMNQLTQNMSQMVHNVQNVNPLGPNITQLTQNMSQLSQNAQNLNQLGQSMNQMTHNMNQMSQNAQNVSHLGQNLNQLGQTLNQLSQNAQNVNPMGQNINQLSQNMNPLNQNTQSVNQMGQSMNPLAQNMNQLAQSNQNMNQIMPNGGQFGPGMGQGINQFHMMNQQRMMAPPPGMSMPRQNFNQNITQYNVNFRGPTVSKPDQPMNQQNMLLNPQLMQQQIKNQSPHNQNVKMNPQQRTSSPKPGQSQPKLNHNLPQNQVVHNQLNQNQLGHNQLGQNQQGQNQLVQNQPIQKPQKSRVYNNSQNNQKPNLTSQNMVQMIQNTHPMLNSNFSMYHNVSHHPMLNNRNVFNNVLNNHPMFNQRHNGTYNNNVNRSMMNGDNSSTFSDTDEYAGLMTQREKQWLINIQMLQLNTGTPYLHDFYYTVFLERQRHKEKEGVKEAHKANQQNHPFYSGAVKQETQTHTRERHNSHRHNSTSEDTAAPRTYVPAQFENSLGKLQCGSVTAPRKIIDAEVVSGEAPSARASRAPSVASTTHPAEVPREMKRTKQLLLDIEALYLILLRLEELNDPLAISNALILKEREEKQKQLEAAQKEALEAEQEEDTNLFLRNIESVQRRPKPDSPKSESVDKRQVVSLASNQKPTPVKNLLDEDKDDLISKMFAGLLHGDRLPQMLTVRKGRTLLGRFLNRVAASHPRLRALWSRVLRALPSAARRDDGSLVQLAQHYRKYIQYSTGWSAILESCSLLSEAFDPARTPYALTSAFTLSCVCALMEKASMLVNTPEATSNERQWNKFLKTLARALKNTTLTVAKPAQPLSETRVLNHVKLLESRSTIEILQRGKSAAEFADLSKADVSEQLIKHLC